MTVGRYHRRVLPRLGECLWDILLHELDAPGQPYLLETTQAQTFSDLSGFLQALASLSYLQPHIEAVHAKAEALDVPTPVIDALKDLLHGAPTLQSHVPYLLTYHLLYYILRPQHPTFILPLHPTTRNNPSPLCPDTRTFQLPILLARTPRRPGTLPTHLRMPKERDNSCRQGGYPRPRLRRSRRAQRHHHHRHRQEYHQP